jgi:membrane protease YdiL (CAAX protease family)
MLFLVKRTWPGGLLTLLVLAMLGLGLRQLVPEPTPIRVAWPALGLGVATFASLLASDGVIHGLLAATFGDPYRRRYRELAEVFRGQTPAAMLTGALTAGLGEELVFRGLSLSPAYLLAAAVAFGLLHNIRRPLWPFTLWSVYQGLLLAAAVYLTENLFVTMVAHFLHDLSGFLLFRYINGYGGRSPGDRPEGV